MPPLAILGGIAASAAGSIGSAAIGAHAAGHAADVQASAAERAAQLQHQDAQAALAFQKEQYGNQQKELAPFISAGQGAITNLSGLLNNGGFPDFGQTFQAPTSVTEQNDPGYQFRLQEGLKALDRAGSASGNLLSGGQQKAEQQYAQDYASNEYGNVYNRALNTFGTNYNIFQQNQANKFNRLASVAGIGQTGTGQLINAGNSATTGVRDILLNEGAQVGQSLQNAAAARASGYVGGANAYGSAIGGIGGDISQLFLLRSLLNQQPEFFGNPH